MKLLKSYYGAGALLSGGKEYPGTYAITAHENAGKRSAVGSIDGIDLAEIFTLHTASDVKLRMADGLVADIVLAGGHLPGPLQFFVNTRLPGL